MKKQEYSCPSRVGAKPAEAPLAPTIKYYMLSKSEDNESKKWGVCGEYNTFGKHFINTEHVD